MTCRLLCGLSLVSSAMVEIAADGRHLRSPEANGSSSQVPRTHFVVRRRCCTRAFNHHRAETLYKPVNHSHAGARELIHLRQQQSGLRQADAITDQHCRIDGSRLDHRQHAAVFKGLHPMAA